MADLISHIVTVFMLVVGLSLTFQARHWLQFTKDVMEAPYKFFSASLLMVAIGSAIVATHNEWSLSWNLAITIYGWALLLKGATLLIFPKFVEWFTGCSDGFFIVWTRVGGAILAVVGAILSYRVWLAG